MSNMPIRPRRNRATSVVRDLLSETSLAPNDFILPLFLYAGKKIVSPVPSLPGVNRYSTDELIKKIQSTIRLGVKAFAIFPAIENQKKDPFAKESTNPDGLLQQSIAKIKSAVPEALIITDVAMDPYSSDGHDGVVRDGKILNDESLEILAAMAISQARAGADIVAPSDMMDGRVGYIRQALDSEGFSEVGILAYTAKYASAFYGPFRNALDSAPKHGDKKTYQMNPANRREALREAALDQNEGADILMVKPALSYLDVILDLRTHSTLPIAAYQVSGEYAMIKAAAERGWIDERAAFIETLTSIKRAGADVILSYYADELFK
jgi:porphobilinogen synthase